MIVKGPLWWLSQYKTMKYWTWGKSSPSYKMISKNKFYAQIYLQLDLLNLICLKIRLIILVGY